jgi:EAL domain-containing protein (putative c-di-GMP-specific phosphodiesterase class I)
MAAGDPRDGMIVRLAAELGNAFGLRVVAEGIEDAAALAPLAALGCHAAQGYGIGRPMPLPQFLAWAQAWTARERPLPLAA